MLLHSLSSLGQKTFDGSSEVPPLSIIRTWLGTILPIEVFELIPRLFLEPRFTGSPLGDNVPSCSPRDELLPSRGMRSSADQDEVPRLSPQDEIPSCSLNFGMKPPGSPLRTRSPLAPLGTKFPGSPLRTF